MEAQLNSGALSGEELLRTSSDLGKIIEELDHCEMRWLELSEKDN